MIRLLVRVSCAAIVTLSGWALAVPVWAVAPQITHHDLEVRLTPDTHGLSATDRLRVVWDPSGGRPLTFELADSMTVHAIGFAHGTDLEWTTTAALQGRQQITVLLPPTAPSELRVVVRYGGTLADEVQAADDLSFVVGDRTQGIISADGIYLSGTTGWTPATGDDLATYRIGVTVPEGWEVCTQGKLIRDGADGGGWRSEWESPIPSEGLALVAGQYVVERRRFGNVVVATYLFPNHARASEQIAEAAAGYIQHFSELLGPYPFPEFAIVENFFSSGYAFPGFTLLGRGVLASPRRMLRPGYLDHEIAHNWWGNGVLVDPREGNWAEALTTYYANYRSVEVQGPAQARSYRERAQLRFSLHAPVGTDYPLSLFQSKTTQLDDAVGYAKGAMFVHLLRRAVGDDVFWPTMRDIAQLHVGTRVGWSTFISALSQRSGQSLDQWAGPWLHRAGAPELSLADIAVVPTATGYTVEGTLVQRGEPYALTLPIRVSTPAGAATGTVRAAGARSRFTVRVPGLPLLVEVDPDAEVLRRLAPDEQRACLNRTLYGGETVCIYPENPRDPRSVLYRQLAERAAQERDGRVLPVSEVTSNVIAGKSVLLFGYHDGHPLLRRLAAAARDVVEIGPQGFALRGERHDRPTDAVLVSVPRPESPGTTVTFFAGNSGHALERASLLFFYGWDSVVRFDAGRPTERFDLPPPSNTLRWDALAAVSDAPNPQDIAATVRRLADPWLAGRLSGSPESRQVQSFIFDGFRRLGLQPVTARGQTEAYRQTFSIPNPELTVARPTVQFLERRGDMHLPVLPVWWSTPAIVRAPVTFAGFGWTDGSWNDYRRASMKGRVAVVLGGGPPGRAPEDAVAALGRQALAAQAHGAVALLAVITEDRLPAFLPAVALPHPELPWPRARRRDRGNAANASPALALRAARVRNSATLPAEPVRIPVWVMLWNADTHPTIGRLQLGRLSARLYARPRPMAQAIRGMELRAGRLWADKPRTGVNIMGLLEGTDPLLRDEIIVVGAHYDHVGVAESGQVFRGADDNASGVAALLATAEMLANRQALLRRSVLFVAFDAEEWGLLGSRAFLDARLVDPERIVAMLNVDSVGRNVDNQVFLVGASRYPDLGRLAARWAEAIGLKVGRNIDEFAYERGSDHWPFGAQGIPALDFFASDYAMLESTLDEPEALDPEHIARVARLLGAVTYELATRPAPDTEPRPAVATVVPALPRPAPPAGPVIGP